MMLIVDGFRDSQEIYNPALVESLFHSVIELPADQREAFLKQRCAGDDRLLSFVSSLLAADEAPLALEHVRDDDPETYIETLGPGSTLGSYRLVRVVGQGGMGTVFLAERADGLFTQQVAVKVISAGFSEPILQVQFARERQILARLNHPSVARLIDGGLTRDHRPYLVMEYVEGKQITQFCNEAGHDVRQRIELFLRVCSAVEAAHQNLIVHRVSNPRTFWSPQPDNRSCWISGSRRYSRTMGGRHTSGPKRCRSSRRIMRALSRPAVRPSPRLPMSTHWERFFMNC